jgi:predicted RNA binding protein YcfA (HicA-like mRNA interferase family)
VTGSHYKLRRIVDDSKQTLLIPVHGSQDLNIKTLSGIYRQASAYLSEDELKSIFYTD